MKDLLLSSAFKVSDSRVAAAFTNPLRRRLILSLASQPQSLVELARDTGIELKKLHYHVCKLREMGLVIVKYTRARAGRDIKVYGAVASAFLVPAGVELSEGYVALMAELRTAFAGLNRRNEGTLYYLNARGEPRMRQMLSADAVRTTATEYWRMLTLTSADALHLIAAVEKCLKAMSERKNGSVRSYLVHFAIAPRSTGARVGVAKRR